MREEGGGEGKGKKRQERGRDGYLKKQTEIYRIIMKMSKTIVVEHKLVGLREAKETGREMC